MSILRLFCLNAHLPACVICNNIPLCPFREFRRLENAGLSQRAVPDMAVGVSMYQWDASPHPPILSILLLQVCIIQSRIRQAGGRGQGVVRSDDRHLGRCRAGPSPGSGRVAGVSHVLCMLVIPRLSSVSPKNTDAQILSAILGAVALKLLRRSLQCVSQVWWFPRATDPLRRRLICPVKDCARRTMAPVRA